MTTVFDPACKVTALVTPCRSCNQPVYFSLTSGGKRAPFEVDAQGGPTRINHFTRCPHAKQWTKRRPAKREDDRNPRLF